MSNYQLFQQGLPLTQASKALILLHGRGGSARDILNLAQKFDDSHFYVAALQAPHHTWYPYSFMVEEKLNEPWLSASVEAVKQLMDEIAKHIPREHIYLLGFSQGACLALETSTRYAAKYGGVIAFTGGLIGSVIDETKYHGAFEATKVFIGNSDQDPHVPLIRSEQSKVLMEKMGAQVTLKIYKGMGHIIHEDEIQWVRDHIFMTKAFPK